MQEQIQEIETENVIWYIYLAIIAANLYSNTLEMQYVYTKDKSYRKWYRKINEIVLWVILCVYLFLIWQLGQAKNSKKKSILLWANLLFLIGTILTLYSFYKYPDSEEDLPIF